MDWPTAGEAAPAGKVPVGRRGGPRPPAWGAPALVLRRRDACARRTGCPRVHASRTPRPTIGITSSSAGVAGARRDLEEAIKAGHGSGRWRGRRGRPVAVDATMPLTRKPARAMTSGVPIPGDRGSGGWGGGRPCGPSVPHRGCWGGGPIFGVVGASRAPFIPDKRAKAGNRYRRAPLPFAYGG